MDGISTPGLLFRREDDGSAVQLSLTCVPELAHCCLVSSFLLVLFRYELKSLESRGCTVLDKSP